MMHLLNVRDKWQVLFFYGDINQEALIETLEKLGCSDRDIDRALEITESINSGFTFTDIDNQASVVCISPATTKEEWYNTLVHELKHVQSHICEYYNIEENSEDAAYLIGFLMKEFLKWLKK